MPSSQVGFFGIGIPEGTSQVIINNQTDDYVLTEADMAGGVYVRMNKATANTVTIPPDLDNNQPVHITQIGLGTTSIVAGVGVTIQSTDNWLKARTRFSNLTLVPIGINSYDLIGDLAE